ncbi:Methyltransferase [uncultured virus]|nr:Methyltransferase [uncultured virus]
MYEIIEKIYDDYSKNYDNLVIETKYIGPEFLENFLKNTNQIFDSVLDIGCANGSSGKIIKKYFPKCNIDGIDISKQMIKLCNETNYYRNLYVKNISDGLPSELKKYDLIIANGCLEFIKNHNYLLKNLYTLLNQHGSFMLTLQETNPGNDNILGLNLETYDEDKTKKLLKESYFKIFSLEKKIGYISLQNKTIYYYFMIIANK